MKGKLDQKQLLILLAIIVVGIILILTDQPPAQESSYSGGSQSRDYYSGGGSGGWGYDCYRCSDTGKCPECHGRKECQFVYGASHPCVNGTIYYGGSRMECTACRGTGDCGTCKGTGRCPYCR
ncbi:MAG: hypothetical protein E7324_01160 [Clostridiales bacterium]|nr:hypothetical protein [Clostridiales bacterium]